MSKANVVMATYSYPEQLAIKRAFSAVAYHTAMGRAFLYSVDKLRQYILQALVLALGYSLGNAINYEAQLLKVPS